MMNPADRFTALQAAVRLRQNTTRAMRNELERQYQKAYFAPKAKRDRLLKAEGAECKASDAFFAYLASISPRDWSRGVPCRWIIDSLTYADAVTPGALSVVPPPAYGYSEADARRFAEPLTPRALVLTSSREYLESTGWGVLAAVAGTTDDLGVVRVRVVYR